MKKNLVVLKSLKLFLFFSLFFSFSYAKIIFDFTWKVVHIYDWDTIRVETPKITYKIRILWIDTPELLHPWIKVKNYKFYWCGEQAKKFAIKYLSGKIVKVYYDSLAKNKDKYNRWLRYVFIKFKNKWKTYWLPYWSIALYKWMAKVYKYENFTLKKIYYKLEHIAKSKKIWIRSNYCQRQDQLIKKQYLKSTNKIYPSNNFHNFNNVTHFYLNNHKNNIFKNCWLTYHKPWCDIKWNINRKWEKIYHLPWRKYYNKTKINPKKWERRFCSEKQAIRCWRRPSYVK